MSSSSHPFALVVHLEVEEHNLQAFISEVSANAEASRLEPGCLRFDVLQDHSNKFKFMLYELYVDAAALAAHRETKHFFRWRDVAVPMLKGDRTRSTYDVISFTTKL